MYGSVLSPPKNIILPNMFSKKQFEVCANHEYKFEYKLKDILKYKKTSYNKNL